MAPESKVDRPPPGAGETAAEIGQNSEPKAPPASEPVVGIGVRSMALTAITVVAFIFLLRYAEDLFVPVVLAILLAYALDPIVVFVARLRLPRPFAASLVLLGVTATVAVGLYALRYQAIEAIEMLPEAAQRVRGKLQEIRRAPAADSALGKIQEAANEIEKTAAEVVGSKEASKGVTKVQIDEPAFRATDFFWAGSVGLAGFFSQAVLVWFLVFFILAAGDLFKRKLVRVIGTKLSEKRVTLEAINEINGQIGRFLLIQVFTSILVGLCTTAALWSFGLNQPAVWGVAAGIFNSIPYVGAIIVTSTIALIAFLQFGSLAITLQIAGVVLAITTLEGFLLTPALMGKAARINGVAMFLSLLFWSWLWGIIGMIVAVPIMMAVKSICERVDGFHPVGELLGERQDKS